MTPRYDGPGVLRFDPPAGDLSVLLLRQLRRLADALATIDPRQWAVQSRCDAWSVQDVVAHLIRTNQAWTASIAAALAGEPTRMFRAFDPVATPPRLVEAMRGSAPAEVLARFVETVENLAGMVAGVDEAAWSLTGETPLGHVGLDAVVMHALWDSWLHERDVLLPLGMTPAEQPDEVAACLRYTAALGPAVLALRGSTRRATLTVDATHPDVHAVIEAGPTVVVRHGPAPPDAVLLTGRAVDLIEGLTFRVPLPAQPDHWLLSGLATAFDVATA